MKLLLEILIRKLWIFRHDFREIGTNKRYSDRSATYECRKCGHELYVPLGMQEMLFMKGCSKRK